MSVPVVVTKFGGTSVATRSGWEAIERIVRRHLRRGRRVVVVCSAVAGVTDRLAALVEHVAAGGDPAARLAELARLHRTLSTSLEIAGDHVLATGERSLAAACAAPRTSAAAARARILAHGELLSTRLGAAWLASRGLGVAWVDARRLLRSDGAGERDDGAYLAARCAPALGELRAALDATGADVMVTQGFIASDAEGDTVLLGRGGSDTSGAYLAVGSSAERLEIWTDVPGVFTADPRRVPDARLVHRLSYGEAEAIAALGAKVLHPGTIEPVRRAGIPVRLGWTGRTLEGTRILRSRPPRGAKAIVSRRDLALLTMWRPSSWQPVGFMAEVAARFQRFGLSMDLIASSPSEIRATVDLAAFPGAGQDLDRLCIELEQVCRPRVRARVACVSVVGAGVTEVVQARGRWFAPLGPAAVHLVSHAANGHHVSVVVDADAEGDLVALAHRDLMAHIGDDASFGPSWASLRAEPRLAAVSPAAAAKSSEVLAEVRA